MKNNIILCFCVGLSLLVVPQVYAEELSKEQCALLQIRKNTLMKNGVSKNMEKGVKWAKDNLKPEALADIKSYLHVKEQLMFRCPQKIDIDDDDDDQADTDTDDKDDKDEKANKDDKNNKKEELKNVKKQDKPNVQEPAAQETVKQQPEKKQPDKKQDVKKEAPKDKDSEKSKTDKNATNATGGNQAGTANQAIEQGSGFQTTVTVKTKPKPVQDQTQILQDPATTQSSGQQNSQQNQVTIQDVEPSKEKMPDAVLGLDSFNTN